MAELLQCRIFRVEGATEVRFGKEMGQSSPLPTWVSNFRYVASFQNWKASEAKVSPNFEYSPHV